MPRFFMKFLKIRFLLLSSLVCWGSLLSADPAPSGLSATPLGETPLRPTEVDAVMQKGRLHTLFLKDLKGDPAELKKKLYAEVRNIAVALFSVEEKAILLRLKNECELKGDLAVSMDDESEEVLSILDGIVRFLKAQGLALLDTGGVVDGNATKTLQTQTLDDEVTSGKLLYVKIGGHYNEGCGPVLDGLIGFHEAVSYLAFDAKTGWALVRLKPSYDLTEDAVKKCIAPALPFFVDKVIPL